MALDTDISMASAKAAVDAVVDRLDLGTGANPRVRIYSGAKPANPDAAVGTGTLLAEIDLGTAAVFQAAATGTGTETNSAVAEAGTAVLPATQTSATASGTAAWARAVDKSGTAIIDGSVGTSSADFIIDNTSIAAGQEVKLTAWKIKLPRG